MSNSRKRMAVLREHIRAESLHDLAGVMDGFTAEGFNDIACLPRKFVGAKAVAERYRAHWRGFPDFKVRVKRVLAADDRCIVTENEWTGTHLGTYWGLKPTGRRVRVRALVVWHFRGDKLKGETVFFDVGSIIKQIGGRVALPKRKPRREQRRIGNRRAA